MPRIELDTCLRDLLGFFRAETRIYGRCPHCGEPFRLSEVKLTYGHAPPRDLLTRLQRERDQLRARIDQLDTRLADQATDFERELAEVRLAAELRHEVEVQRRLQHETKRIRAQAVAASRAITLGKTIERVAPLFSGFGHFPGDVRPLFEPIDFVCFDGLYAGCVTDVTIVEFKTARSRLTPVQHSIAEAIAAGRVHFEERRIGSEMLRRLECGRPPPRGQPLIDGCAPRGQDNTSGDEHGESHA